MNATATPRKHKTVGAATGIKREAIFQWQGTKWRLRVQGETAVIQRQVLPVGRQPYWESCITAWFCCDTLTRASACGAIIADHSAELGYCSLTTDPPRQLIRAAIRAIPRLERYY